MLTTTILFVGSCIVRAVDPDFFIDHIGLAVVISILAVINMPVDVFRILTRD